MTGIKWEDPSLGGKGRVKHNWSAIFSELRAHPGKWALIAEDAPTSTATNIKSGMYANSSRGEFEAVARDSTLESRYNRGKIYARYVGGSDA